MDHPITDKPQYKLFSKHLLHGKYKGHTISNVMKKDLPYIDELIRLGIYKPSATAREKMVGIRRGDMSEEMRLDDATYYQNEEHGA